MAGEIFISYRRSDSSGFAGRLYDHLKHEFMSSSIFMDVDDISPGTNFAEVLNEQVSMCKVLLAVIGQNWLTASDGEIRLHDANDFVRIEIEAAFAQNVTIIPVLADGAKMPETDDLPQSLANLAHIQAIRITHEHFGTDAGRLVRLLRQILDIRQSDQRELTAAWPATSKLAVVLPKEQLMSFVDKWEGEGIYVFNKPYRITADSDTPRSRKWRLSNTRVLKNLDDVSTIVRSHCVIPDREYIGAAFLSFKYDRAHRCLAVCQSGFYYFHSDDDGPLERLFIPLRAFMESPVEMDGMRLTIGNETRYLSGYHFNFDGRKVAGYLTELQVRIRNEVRFSSTGAARY